jgi:hypothetical protein
MQSALFHLVFLMLV